MSKIKFYTDEHIGKAIVNGLRLREVDVITCVEAGLRTESDKVHLAYALENRRVIITMDNDFLKLHAEGKEHAGIAFSFQQKSIGEMVQGLYLIHEILDAEDMFNQVEYL